MTKKIEKHDKGFSLNLDQRTVDTLCIDETTELDLFIKDGSLIITPRHKNDQLVEKKQKKFKNSVKHLMDKYEPVLKKLSKS